MCLAAYVNVAQAKHLLIYGDSLSAAFGIELEQGWVSLLNKELSGLHYVSNASVSGETSAGGLNRLPQTLKELQPDIVLLELGANDGLRGYPIAKIKEQLGTMIGLIQASGAQAILAGISIPANYGPRYVDQFHALFAQTATQYNIPYINLYSLKFITTPGLMQADGIHPSAKAQPLILKSVRDFLHQSKVLPLENH